MNVRLRQVPTQLNQPNSQQLRCNLGITHASRVNPSRPTASLSDIRSEIIVSIFSNNSITGRLRTSGFIIYQSEFKSWIFFVREKRKNHEKTYKNLTVNSIPDLTFFIRFKIRLFVQYCIGIIIERSMTEKYVLGLESQFGIHFVRYREKL